MKIIQSIIFLGIIINSQSCKKSEIISEADLYNFMNEVIFESKEPILNEIEVGKIQSNSIEFNGAIQHFIWKQDLSLKEKLYLYKQSFHEPIEWDCSKFKNVKCLSGNDIMEIFNPGDGIQENRSKEAIEDPWEVFRRQYGSGGISEFSIPIFNYEQDLAIIEFGVQSDWTSGVGNLLLYKKKEGKWELETKDLTWISEIKNAYNTVYKPLSLRFGSL